jgi:methyl-accepting chemotaxis protein
MNALLTAWVAREDLMALRTTAGETVTQGSKEITLLEMDEVTTIGTDAEKALSSASSIMLVGLIVALVVGCVVALVITRSITGPLNRAIAAMTAGSQEGDSAAGQISTASQNLAEGATEQASSLEESSSALEELASQAGGNAEKAKRATDGAETAQKAAEQASEALHETVRAMNEIKESSNRISGIIKTIEEIAFQTNLLALNAAVEAARAGEHGKGFAVVAEEVRNLAQRSAVAAKDTATLIQTSVEQSNRGAEVVGKASEAIVRILDVASQVARDAREVKTASEEQSEGSHQINNAVAAMDKVTQQVASNAEETASASEELSAQSQQMQAIVGDLVRLVGGARGNGYSNGNGHRPLRLEVSTAAPSRLPDRKTSPRLGHSVASASSRKAAAAIPFDRDEQNMADF